MKQAYSPTDGRFLPDRYIVGTCPHCNSPAARGDQCESCTRLLDPEDLIAPRSAVSGASDIEFRETRHLFQRLPRLEPELRSWIESRSEWSELVRSIALKWLNEGLRDRCITRDLDWGVPVPKPGFEDKVFYVWFDAPIGYIAAAVEWAEAAPGRDWRAWWEGGEDVRYLQFLAKDNVPFHAISFPAAIIGSGLPLKLADVIKGFNWLTYEGGKFSTSQGRGLFTDAALDKLPADCWRWWLAANAPEGADVDFTVDLFVAGVNKDLADTFGNLVNRCLAFIAAHFSSVIPAGGEAGPAEHSALHALDRHLRDLRRHHEALSFRKAAEEVRAIWRLGNAYLAEAAPWSAIRHDSARAAVIVRTGVHLVRAAALAAWPFIPTAAETVLGSLDEKWNGDAAVPAIEPGRRLRVPPLLFRKITAADLG